MTAPLSEDEFMRRLRARFVEVAGEGADSTADLCTYAEWSENWTDDPEGAADSEMEHWDNDGDDS